MKKLINEFKEFALKGNVLDMAIGVVIGAAFGKIVTSLVTDIITPLISLLTGEVSLTGLKYVFKPETIDLLTGEVTQTEIALTYGNFIQSIIDFFLIALSIFLVMKLLMTAKKKLEALKKKEDEKKEEAPAAPTETELSVLQEIKALLQQQNK